MAPAMISAPPVQVPDAESMRALGRRLARILRAGDLVLLGGELGAGKTTLAQGIGAGLGVRGPVTSPTFVITRVHPPLDDGPPLVHVDAYRLRGWDEVEDLDLEATLDEAVTVVEWGEGLAEGLGPDRLEVHIHRPTGNARAEHSASVEPVADEADVREVTMTGVGARWAGVDVAAL
jgi:tRNA threonylcarbamoyladenosine biosynthesis protein TsaE